jgi:hypothetical protein
MATACGTDPLPPTQDARTTLAVAHAGIEARALGATARRAVVEEDWEAIVAAVLALYKPARLRPADVKRGDHP